MQDPSYKLQILIQAELGVGERMVWNSAPSPARLARKSLPAVIFGIPWTAFALFWMAGASGFKMPDFNHFTSYFSLFGVPFVLIGFGMLSSPLWASRRASSSAYVITNQRAIIFECQPWGRTSIHSFFPNQLAAVRRIQLADGSGDLILDKKISTDGEGSRSTTDIGFFGIPDVKQVEGMIFTLAKTTAR